ncbi:MAG: ATP-binding protein [Breznakibacter sp.]
MRPDCHVLVYCSQFGLLSDILPRFESYGIKLIGNPVSNVEELVRAVLHYSGKAPDALLVIAPLPEGHHKLLGNHAPIFKSLPIIVLRSKEEEVPEPSDFGFDAQITFEELKWLPYQVHYFLGQKRPNQSLECTEGTVTGIENSDALYGLALAKAAFEITFDALLVLDNDNRIVRYNSRFLRMWQVAEEKFHSSSNQELSAFFGAQLLIPKSFVDPQSPDYIDPNLVSSDTLHFVDGRKYEVFSQPQVVKGLTVGRVWSFRDITIRKKIEKELNESTIKLKTIVNNLRGVVFSCRTDGNLTMLFLSQGIEELSGYPSTDFLHNKIRSFGSIVHPEDVLHIHGEIEKAYFHSPPISMEFRIICAEGMVKWIWVRGAIVRDADQASLLEGFMSDITDRKKTQMQLEWAKSKSEESDKLKTAFLHNISHEIRTPINAILGFSRLLEDESLMLEKRRRFNQVILSSANHLIAIIDDIVDMAAIEAQQVAIKAEPVDVAGILRTLYVQYAPKAKDKGLSVRCLIDPMLEGGSRYMADQTKLIQIFTNLLNNAFKFTNQGGIAFGVDRNGDGLRFFVKDTGIGIPEEMQTRIFERFLQVDQHSKQAGGMGLGLAICKAYVELMGSTLEVISHLGTGSEFYFTLFLDKAVQAEIQSVSQVSRMEDQRAQNNLILIAEDEQTNFMLMSEMLNVLKLPYLRASNGIEAVTMCRENPNLKMVLMDVKMPLLDGLEATRQIREFASQLPIIAVTAYTYSHGKKQVIEAGCTDYVTKPISFNGLKALVAKYM